jgi:probable HAF family extracellular repeat protein
MCRPSAALAVRRLFLSLLVACASGAMAKPRVDPGGAPWTITRLEDLGSATAMGVNNRGDIVGSVSFFDPAVNGNRTHAALWQNGQLQDLGEGMIVDVTERGTLLGSIAGYNGIALYEDGAWRSFGFSGSPVAINKAEDLCGWYPSDGYPRAFASRRGVVFDLGTLGGASSVPTGIDDHGRVVGYSATAQGNDHAFLYERGRLKDLGTLAGGRVSRAAAINNHGVVVGEAWDVNNFALPFIYDGTMRVLFPAPLGTKAWALNNRNAVVGTYAGTQSFLYDDGVVTILEQIPEVQAAGWVQLIPTAINDRGWIVGMGRTSAPVPPGHMPWTAFLLQPR